MIELLDEANRAPLYEMPNGVLRTMRAVIAGGVAIAVYAVTRRKH